jgi:hypothetical protein
MEKKEEDEIIYTSEDEAFEGLECFFNNEVRVTEDVLLSFDWKSHLDLAFSTTFYEEHTDGTYEEGAYPIVIQAYRKDGRCYLGYCNLSEDMIDEMLHLAELGYRSLNHKNDKEVTNVR